MSTMTKYEVMEESETGEAIPGVTKPRSPKADPVGAPSDASSMAVMMQELAKKTAMQTVGMVHEEIAKNEAKRMATLEAEIARMSSLYAKPQSLCLHVKINDAPIKKLKQRVSPLLPDLIAQIASGQRGKKWPCIMGPSGSGKTVAANQVAEVKGCFFAAINGSPDLGLSSLFGRSTAQGFINGPLWVAATTGGGMFFDEMDAFAGSVLVGVNAITSAKVGQILTNPLSGEVLPMHKDAWFIAAMNTNGKGGDGAYTGRERLDAASLNRFELFDMAYDCELERTLCPDTKLLEVLWGIRVKLQEKNSKDIISTRDIDAAYDRVANNGASFEKVLASLALRMDKANKDLFVVKGGK